MAQQVHSVAIGINPAGAVAGAATASTAFTSVGTAAVASGKKVQGFGNNIKFLVGGLVGLMIIKDIVKTMVDFEKTMRVVDIVTRNSAKSIDAHTKSMKEMEVIARELGATTRFTATEAAEGMTFLARAGFSASQVMEMIPHTLNLATAAMIDLGVSSDMVANTIHQFSLQASDAERVVDSFLITANNANTDVLQLGQALSYAGTFAGALGISLEETNAALGILADSGIKGSMAGTSMRGVFAALIKPTDQATNALRKLGLTAEDVNPAIHDLETIMRRLKQGQTELARESDFAAVMLEIFSRRPVAGALALTKMNVELGRSVELQRMLAGETAEAAKMMEDTLFGALKALRSALQEAWLATGDSGFGGGLRNLVDIMTMTVRHMSGMSEAVTSFHTTALLLASVLKLLITRMIAMLAIKIVVWLYTLGAAVVALTLKVGSLTAAMKANPIGLFATGFAIAAVAIWDMTNASYAAAQAQKQLVSEMKEMEDIELAIAASDTLVDRVDLYIKLAEKANKLRADFQEIHNIVETDVLRTTQEDRYGDDTYGVPLGGEEIATLENSYAINIRGFWRTIRQVLGSELAETWDALTTKSETSMDAVTKVMDTFLAEQVKQFTEWQAILGENNKNIADLNDKQLEELTSFINQYRIKLQDYSSKKSTERFEGMGLPEGFGKVIPEGFEDVESFITVLTRLKALLVSLSDEKVGGDVIDTDAMHSAQVQMRALVETLEFEIKIVGELEEAQKRLRTERKIGQIIQKAGFSLGGEEHQQLLALQSDLDEQTRVYREQADTLTWINGLINDHITLVDREKLAISELKTELAFQNKLLRIEEEEGRTLAQLKQEMVILRQAEASMTTLEKDAKIALIETIRVLIRANQDLEDATTSPYASLLADLNAERELLGKTTEERQRYNYQRMITAQLSNEEGAEAKIRFLMAEYDMVKQLEEGYKAYGLTLVQVQEAFARAFTSATMSVINGSASMIDALGNVIIMLLEMIIQAVIYQTIMGAFKAGGVVQGGGGGAGGWSGQGASPTDTSVPWAMGGVVSDGVQQPFAQGGVVSEGIQQRFATGGVVSEGIQQRFATGGVVSEGIQQRFATGGVVSEGIQQRFATGGVVSEGIQQRFATGGVVTDGIQQVFEAGGVVSKGIQQAFEAGGVVSDGIQQRFATGGVVSSGVQSRMQRTGGIVSNNSSVGGVQMGSVQQVVMQMGSVRQQFSIGGVVTDGVRQTFAQGGVVTDGVQQTFAKGGVVTGGSTGNVEIKNMLQPFAMGGVVSSGSIQPFAGGGLVTKPTIFPMANGYGLMGEAGPEAIMPLTRTSSGELGVKSEGGGGSGNILINMNVTTSDADSFRKSQKQITRELSRGMRSAAAT